MDSSVTERGGERDERGQFEPVERGRTVFLIIQTIRAFRLWYMVEIEMLAFRTCSAGSRNKAWDEHVVHVVHEYTSCSVLLMSYFCYI